MLNLTDLRQLSRLREATPPGFGLSPETADERCGNCSAFDADAQLCSRFADFPTTAPYWCERWTPGAMREATYGSGAQEVYYEDGDTYSDLTDLFTVVSQNRGTGSPNLENGQVENMARTIYEHRPLSAMEIGLLKRLLAKYASEIEQLRASPDREGQDYTAAPDPATARFVTGGS